MRANEVKESYVIKFHYSCKDGERSYVLIWASPTWKILGGNWKKLGLENGGYADGKYLLPGSSPVTHETDPQTAANL